MFLSHLYLITIAVAFGSSLFSFKLSYPKHLQLISFLLGLTVVTEFLAIDGWKAMGLKNNMILYNPFMLIEFCVYANFFKQITQFNWLRKVISWYFILFPIVWFICTFILFGIYNWNSYVSVIGSAFMIFFASVYYYEILATPAIKRLNNLPEFWITTGIVVFYAGNLPFTGMLNFLIQNYVDLATQFTYILKVLNIVMYSLFTYAFLCRTSITNLKH